MRTIILSVLAVLELSTNVYAQNVELIPRNTPKSDIEIIQSRVCPMLNQNYTVGETINIIRQMIVASREGRLAGKLSSTYPNYTDSLLQESQELIEKNDQMTAKSIVTSEVHLYCRQHLPLLEQLQN